MKRTKTKRYGKIGRFFKWLVTNITNITKIMPLVVSVIIVVVFVVLVVLAIVEKSTLKINFEKGWQWPDITVMHKGDTRKDITLPKLASKVELKMVPERLYDEEARKRKEVEEAFRQFVAKAVEISRLPPELQGSPDEVVAKISGLWQERQKQRSSIWYSCYVISMEIALEVSIDTSRPSNNYHTKEVYRCVLRCLNVIGYYDGEIDGDQGRTKAAVATFQKDNGLQVDYKVGRATWCTILIMLAEEIHGKLPSGLKYTRL